MITIANFVLDEKFIDGLIEFDDYVCDNNIIRDYYLISNKKGKTFNYIKKHPNRISIIRSSDALRLASKYDAVFLHSLYTFPIRKIHLIEKKVKVFWFSWGYDIYSSPLGDPLIRLGLFHPLTKEYLSKDYSGRFLSFLRKINSYRKKENRCFFLKAVNRVDFYSGVIPEEYDLLKKSVLEFRAERVDYSYCTLSSFPEKGIMSNRQKNILIGNSTAYENNHLDLFDVLKDIDLAGRKIIVPLSYSPNPKYVGKLKEEGHRLFGDDFVAITDFMPYSDYMKIIRSCGFAIFGAERQHAMGNIYMSLGNGCKVFLYESSIIYKYLKRLDFRVFRICDLSHEDSLHNLSDDEIYHNVNLFYEHFNENVMVNKIRKILKIIDNGS